MSNDLVIRTHPVLDAWCILGPQHDADGTVIARRVIYGPATLPACIAELPHLRALEREVRPQVSLRGLVAASLLVKGSKDAAGTKHGMGAR